jgi:hypothetical protein
MSRTSQSFAPRTHFKCRRARSTARLGAGEAWLVAGQTVLGGWTANPWSEDFVAAVVLEYLERRGAMLPQVDGFLLMARDFFRKAEDLRLEDGALMNPLIFHQTIQSHAVDS